jgi:seryl-tRNA synthetase
MFEPIKLIQPRCVNCTIEFARKVVTEQRAKKQRLERKELKETIKTSKDYRNELQRKINALVRLIDEGCKCISCGQVKDSLDAGHFKSSGSNRTVTFHLLNIWGQCRACNSYRDSKYQYIDGLTDLVGEDLFDVIVNLSAEWKELKLNIEQLKEASKNVTECMKFVKEYKSDKILPLLPNERIQIRKVCNNLIGIY